MAKGPSVYERLAGGTRKQRKELQRQLHTENPGLELVHPNAAGIDIGNESHLWPCRRRAIPGLSGSLAVGRRI